jgi:hypothetical protein
MKIRFTQSYRGYKRGDVVEVTQRLGTILQEHGFAIADHQQALIEGLPAQLPTERGVAPRPEIRTATTR